jgi:hypothetical protein
MSTTEPFMPADEPLDTDSPESTDVEGDRDGAVDVLPDAASATQDNAVAPRSDDPAADADDPAFRTPTPGERLTADELEAQIGDGA